MRPTDPGECSKYMRIAKKIFLILERNFLNSRPNYTTARATSMSSLKESVNVN